MVCGLWSNRRPTVNGQSHSRCSPTSDNNNICCSISLSRMRLPTRASHPPILNFPIHPLLCNNPAVNIGVGVYGRTTYLSSFRRERLSTLFLDTSSPPPPPPCHWNAGSCGACLIDNLLHLGSLSNLAVELQWRLTLMRTPGISDGHTTHTHTPSSSSTPLPPILS